MAYVYDLTNDYSSNGEDDYISYSPYWAVVIFGLANPITYSRKNGKTAVEVKDAVKLRGAPLIIETCSSLQITNDKRSHTKSMSAQVRNTGLNLLNSKNAIPGDWIMAWCWTNEADRERTLENIRTGKQANDSRSGLKFVGRLHDIRKDLSVSGDGRKESSYTLQAVGFDELDTQMFYDKRLASAAAAGQNVGDFALFMAQVGLDFFNFVDSTSVEHVKKNAKDASKLIQDNSAVLIESLLEIIVGESTKRGNVEIDGALQFIKPNNKDSLHRTTPNTYVIPTEIVRTLNANPSFHFDDPTRMNKYSNILESIIGVQTYNQKKDGELPSRELQSKMFYPEIGKNENRGANRNRTKEQLKGTHLPLEPSFVDKPLFTVLQTYLNPAINEMYTALKMNQSGDIVPTLVVRQIPFSTDAAVESKEFPLTRFLSLPRWGVSPAMVRQLSVGRTNSTRFNMVALYGEANAFSDALSQTRQLTLNPPIFDLADVARSGIRPLIQTVNCTLSDQARQTESRPWLLAIADWSLGSHLTLNGQITVTGIQSPIAEGDNIEFEGVVYHVEAVRHSCSIEGEGGKNFSTVLSLSNGIPSEQPVYDNSLDFDERYPRYPGFVVNVSKEIEPLKVLEILVTGKAKAKATTSEDNEILRSQDPGESYEES